jgi:hypothetical protein
MLGEVLHDSVDQLAYAAEAAGQDRLLAGKRNRPDNKSKFMSDNLIRVPARSLKEQFSKNH